MEMEIEETFLKDRQRQYAQPHISHSAMLVQLVQSVNSCVNQFEVSGATALNLTVF